MKQDTLKDCVAYMFVHNGPARDGTPKFKALVDIGDKIKSAIYYTIHNKWCDNHDYQLMKALTKLKGIPPKAKPIALDIMK